MNNLQITLKTLRKEKNLTQTEVAKIVNVHQVTYQGWEKGKSTPDLEKILKLAKYYKVSTDYLTGMSYDNV